MTESTTSPKGRLLAAGIVIVGFAVLYWQVLTKLVMDWYNDDNYSHGFLIVPIAAYFAWERRDRLKAAARNPSILGLFVVIASIGVLLAGILGSELFLTRISIVGVLVGAVLFMFGWRHLRILTFPLAFLLLMIPIPAILFNQIAFPLQLLASRFGETVMSAADVPVLREGNVLILANTTLEVAEACSGIRSLVSLLTLAIVLGYFSDRRMWVRVAVALSSIPVAVVTNGLRVAGTGIAAHRFGPAAAEGFIHEFSGWLVFVAAFALTIVIQRLISVVSPEPRPAPIPSSV
ncbi:MAG TPA: exosortase A [Vicinamibacterales bacterium]|nr:exosortase A [Vicinamibacterales bacterium]